MKSDIELLKNIISTVVSNKLDIDKQKFDLTNFKDRRAEYCKNTIELCIKRFKNLDFGNANLSKLVSAIEKFYSERNFSEMLRLVNELAKNIKETNKEKLRIAIPRLPAEISKEITADTRELERCLESGCYRSAVILCGRILETALHRKYYEISGRDILETSPGIGLGNLIAKLKEKNFVFDPGLSEQIHLINQMRIYSVHKKKESFYPTKEQAHAMMLYTIDVLNKLFK